MVLTSPCMLYLKSPWSAATAVTSLFGCVNHAGLSQNMQGCSRPIQGQDAGSVGLAESGEPESPLDEATKTEPKA